MSRVEGPYGSYHVGDMGCKSIEYYLIVLDVFNSLHVDRKMEFCELLHMMVLS